MLKLENINKTFNQGTIDEKVLFSDFNISVGKGEFVAVVGSNGSGKTTMLNIISGDVLPDSGKVILDGADISKQKNYKRATKIARVFQNPSVGTCPSMTIFENMSIADNKAKRYSLTPGLNSKRKEFYQTQLEILGMGLENRLDTKAGTLSGGQRQRVALGRAIVREPKVFLMDEPLSNLDAKLRVQMRTEISKLHHRLETTFIYVTHDQTEAMTMGTRIVVMKDGFIQQVDTPQNLYDMPVNLFVAGFMGSPQMNFIDCKLEKRNGSFYLHFAGTEVKLPDGKATPELDAYDGKDVIFGIRPENIFDDQAHITAFPEHVCEAKITVTEKMGSETYLYMNIGETSCVARVDPRTTAKVGDQIQIALDMTKAHLFDKETELAIIH
mgnify:CR=1 FL=1